MRIVFMGTPDFAVATLRALVENGHKVVGVVTMPDKPAGRGHHLQYSAVKDYALEQNLPLLQPERLKDEAFLEALRDWQADLQIVVAFRMLPEVVWNMPPHGTINLHASLLPQYRGAAPINWAIINGEKETGVTTFFLQQAIDTGDLIAQTKVAIANDETAGTLHDRLMDVGADLVLTTLRQIEEGHVNAMPQIESAELRAAPKIFKETCRLDFSLSTAALYNFVRGLSPYPGTWTEFVPESGEGFVVKIFTVAPETASHSLKPGTIVCDGKQTLKLATTDGYIHLLDLQLAGKKRMTVQELLRGYAALLSGCKTAK